MSALGRVADDQLQITSARKLFLLLRRMASGRREGIKKAVGATRSSLEERGEVSWRRSCALHVKDL